MDWTLPCPLQSSPQLRGPATDQQQPRTGKLHTEAPAATLTVSLRNWPFCAHSFHPMLQGLSQVSLPGPKYLASYRESFLDIFPAKDSCSAAAYISEGCKMLTIWAILLSNRTTTSLNKGWKGFLLLWHGLACPEMGTPVTAWSEEQEHQTSWSGKQNIKEKEEPPHCHPDIVVTEMNACIFHTWTMGAHCKERFALLSSKSSRAEHSHCLLGMGLFQIKDHSTPKLVFSAAYTGALRSSATGFSEIDYFN